MQSRRSRRNNHQLLLLLLLQGCLWLAVSFGSGGPRGTGFYWFVDDSNNNNKNADHYYSSVVAVQAFSFTAIASSSTRRRRRRRHQKHDQNRYRHDDDRVFVVLHSSMSDEPNQRGTASNNNEDDDAAAAEARRMATVRYLQQAFYKSDNNSDNNNAAASTSSVSSSFQEEPNGQNGGWLRNVCLWRVPWVELPGRTNVLNVFEPIYTNMFEQLLRSNHSYFGHIYLQDGSKNLKTIPQRDWQQLDNTNKTKKDQSSSVLGTLMRITDYQRLPNGRLLLLVQAMERFVVTKVQQNLPYCRADVQLLPDLEYDATTSSTDAAVVVWLPRTNVILRNWAWKKYEFEDSKFASSSSSVTGQLTGSVLAQVLPYAAMNVHQIPTLHDDNDDNDNDSTMMWPPSADAVTTTTTKATTAKQISTIDIEPGLDRSNNDGLEQKLMEQGILLKPDTMDDMTNINTTSNVSSLADDLELQLWWALNDYLFTSKTPVSPILLGLLPPDVEWADDFVLKKIADTLQSTTEYRHKYTPVCQQYPKTMRQRRLSFHAAYLVCKDQTDRAELLAMSNHVMRMQAVLWKLEMYNRSFQ